MMSGGAYGFLADDGVPILGYDYDLWMVQS